MVNVIKMKISKIKSVYTKYLGCTRPNKQIIEWLLNANIDMNIATNEKCDLYFKKFTKLFVNIIIGIIINNQVES